MKYLTGLFSIGFFKKNRRSLSFLIGILLLLRIASDVLSPQNEKTASELTYTRVASWIESSDCFLKTGVFLAACVKGNVVPIEDESIGDDRGHTLLSDLVAGFQDQPITRLQLVQANIWLNALSFLALLAALSAAGYQGAALGLALYFALMGFRWPMASADVLAAYTGCAFLGGATIFWLAAIFKTRNHFRILYLIFSAVSLALANLIREPLGVAALIGCLVFCFFYFLKAQGHERRVCVLSALVLILAAKSILPLLLRTRDTLYHLPPAQSWASHGVAHNIFLGLGTEANPWGIKWDDAYGVAEARKVSPNVVVFTPEYSKILWHRYFEIIKADPFEVLKIYIKKTAKSLAVLFIYPFGTALFLLALLAYFYRRRQHSLSLGDQLMLSLGICFLAFLAQGILGLPIRDMLTPAIVILIPMAFVLLEESWRLPARAHSHQPE